MISNYSKEQLIEYISNSGYIDSDVGIILGNVNMDTEIFEMIVKKIDEEVSNFYWISKHSVLKYMK